MKKLRKKFILVAMASMFVVLLLMIGGLNVLNYHNLIENGDPADQDDQRQRRFFSKESEGPECSTSGSAPGRETGQGTTGRYGAAGWKQGTAV